MIKSKHFILYKTTFKMQKVFSSHKSCLKYYLWRNDSMFVYYTCGHRVTEQFLRELNMQSTLDISIYSPIGYS